MSSGIGLDESNNDAEKRTASTEEQVLQKKSGMVDTVPQLEKVAGQQGGEDSILGPQEDSENLADESEAASVVLLCLSGTVEGHFVTFLIDSGASDCFVSTEFVEEHELRKTKTKEKLKIHLADGSVRVSNECVKQVCVTFGEHAEFLDLQFMKLPKYEVILGKPWLDRWNPQINWKENTMKWKVGSRVIEITGLQEAQPKKEISSLFHLGSYVEEISAQRMRRISQREPVFIAVIRSVEEMNEKIVEINEEKTKTEYSVAVQEFRRNFLMYFLKTCREDYPLFVK